MCLPAKGPPLALHIALANLPSSLSMLLMCAVRRRITPYSALPLLPTTPLAEPLANKPLELDWHPAGA